MTFDKSDLVTFALGALAAAAYPLGEALIKFSEEPVDDWGKWVAGLAVGIGGALLRYLTTRVSERLVQ